MSRPLHRRFQLKVILSMLSLALLSSGLFWFLGGASEMPPPKRESAPPPRLPSSPAPTSKEVSPKEPLAPLLDDLSLSETSAEASNHTGPPESEPEEEPEVEAEIWVLSGQVVDAEGEGIEGAALELSGGDWVTGVQSSETGAFEVALELEEVPPTLQVTAPGFAAVTFPGVAPEISPLSIVMRRGVTLGGRLVNEIGEPVIGEVRLGAPGLFPPMLRATNSMGVFEFSGLDPGVYHLLGLGAEGSSFFSTKVELGETSGEIELEVHRGVPLRVQLREGRARKLNSDDEIIISSAIVGALVTLSDEDMHVLSIQKITDESGGADFGALVPGRYHLSVRAPGFLPSAPLHFEHPVTSFVLPTHSIEEGVSFSRMRPEVLESIPKESLLGLVVVPLRRGVRLRGQVHSEDGVPIIGARLIVSVVTPQGAIWRLDKDTSGAMDRLVRPKDEASALQGPPKRFISGGAGRFFLAGIPPGELRIEGRKEGWIPTPSPDLKFREGDFAEGLQVIMSRGVPIMGEVLGANGEPLEDARVRWRFPNEPLPWRGEVYCDSRGLFSFKGVSKSLVFEASAEGFATAEFPTDALQTPAATLRLEALVGEINGHIRGPDESNLVGAYIHAAKTLTGAPHRCSGKTQGHGNFSLADCGDQPLILEVLTETFPPTRVLAVSGEWSAVKLESGGGVRGQIVVSLGGSSLGDTLATATLTAHAKLPVQGSTKTWAWHLENALERGEIDLSMLSAGIYSLNLTQAGHLDWSTEVTVKSGEIKDLGEISMKPKEQLQGHVVDLYQSPIAGARVTLAGHSAVTDSSGAFLLPKPPKGGTLRAVHWEVGEGAVEILSTQGAPDEGVDAEESLLVVLDEDIGAEEWVDWIEPDGITLTPSAKGWVVSWVQPDSLWGAQGVVVGDELEGLLASEGRVLSIALIHDGSRREVLRHDLSP